MTLEQIKKALEHRNLNKVSETTGIPYNHLWRIREGRVAEPSYRIIDSIRDYLENN